MISVIIPVYNVELFLKECLDSILKQTLNQNAIEVIMVDDCSKDNSSKIALQYSKEFSNFKYIKNPKNLGLAKTRNVGLDNLGEDSKFIYFLDSDDYLNSQSLEILLKGSKECIAISNMVRFFGKHEEELEREKFIESEVPIRDFLCGVLWPAHLEEKLRHSTDIRYFEDNRPVKIASEKARVKYFKESKYYYRINPNSISNSLNNLQEKWEDRALEICRLIKELNVKSLKSLMETSSDEILNALYLSNDLKRTRKYYKKIKPFVIASKKQTKIIKILLSNPIYFIASKTRIKFLIFKFYFKRKLKKTTKNN